MDQVDSQQLCKSCRQLDVEKLFSEAHTSKRYSAVLENNPSCSLCRTIADHHSTHHDPSSTDDVEFQIFAQSARGALDLHGYDDNAFDSSKEANYLRVTWPLKNNTGCLTTTPGTFLALSSEHAFGARTRLNQRMIKSRINYPLIQEWLKKCQRDHDTCRSLEVTTTPPSEKFKLIDVESGNVCRAPQWASYACLSYVWGGKRRFSGSSNAQVPSVLPKTIQDAILVTKGLGLRYLWVDALCIDQSDPDELVIQVNSMASVYSRAYLTIVAVSSTSSDDGLPGVSSDRSTAEYQTSTMIHGKQLIISDIICTAEPFLRSVWNKRGWTMQEALFAHRCLCFTEFEIFLWCREHVFRESIAEPTDSFSVLPRYQKQGSPKPPMQISISGQWEFERYTKLVNIYTHREFSFDTEVLEAFSGTIAHFKTISGTQFHFGLPEDNFITALLWTVEPGGQERKLPKNLVPTWTWARWTKASYYYTVLRSEKGDPRVRYRWGHGNLSSVQELSAAKISFPPEYGLLPNMIIVDTQVIRLRFQRDLSQRSDEQKQCGCLWSLHSTTGKLIEDRLGRLDTCLAQLSRGQQEALLSEDVEMILLVRWKGLRLIALMDAGDDDFVLGLLIRRVGDAAERIALVRITTCQWNEIEKTNEKVWLT